MEYLSVKEVAELKGCSERYIQNCISKGKLEAIEKLNAKGKIKFYVPISALPDDIRAKYYKQIRRDENAPPELKEDTAETSLKRHKNAIKRSFEEYSEAERNEITRWVKILEEWQALRSRYNKKTEFDPLYCSKIKIEQPDINISPDILYKKLAAYRGQNLDGLLDGRGGWNRNNFNINEKVWKAFLWFYLDERQPRISECYRNVCDWTAEFYPELLDCMPTERSFRRHVKSDIDKPTSVRAKRHCLTDVRRMWSDYTIIFMPIARGLRTIIRLTLFLSMVKPITDFISRCFRTLKAALL